MWHFRDHGVAGYHSFADIRTSYVVGFSVHLPTPWTDLTIYAVTSVLSCCTCRTSIYVNDLRNMVAYV